MTRRSPAVLLYGLLIRLLPRAFRRDYGEEVVEVFARQWADAAEAGRRWFVAVRVFGRLPGVIAAEWRDHVQALRQTRTEVRRGERMSGLWRMVRQATRSLRRSPGFTLTVVVLLGLGVGSATAIWAIVDHVLLRPLPYPAAERLFEVQNGSHSGPAYGDFLRMESVEAWAAVATRDARLTGAGDPLRVVEAAVSPDFFALFGGRPALGRLLSVDDHRGSDAVVLSHGTWLRIWGGDPGVVGRTIRIDGRPLVVVGVLDASFRPPESLLDPSADVWRPLDFGSPDLVRRSHHVLSVAGRLAPGATLVDAQRDANLVAANRARAYPDQYRDREDGRISELPIVSLQESTVGGVRRGLGLVLGAVGVLLLVACVNVTHLFLARGVERVREMSVRRALGAGTGALAGQLLVESVLIGVAGAVLGVALAAAGLRTFMLLAPARLPRVDAIAIDARVLAFSALLGVATAVIFGLVPALRVAGGSASELLRAGGRSITGSRRAQAVRTGLVVAEAALSLILVAQAGWLLRGFIRLNQEPLGFRTENIVTMPLTPTQISSPEEWRRRTGALRSALEKVPGVRAATFGLTIPLQYTGGSRCCWYTRVTIEGTESPPVIIHPVQAAYFRVFDLPVLAGRAWSVQEEDAVPRPVVVSEPFAIQVFGSAAAAIGRGFDLNDTPVHITGVVADNRHFGIDQDHGAALYVPISAMPFVPIDLHMAVLTANPPHDLPTLLRAAVWQVEPELPVPTIRPMEEWASAAAAQRRFASVLFAIFAGVALLLVAGGLSGTLMYMVRLQRKDLGIRLALGATASGLERRVLFRGFGMAMVGAALGAIGAWASGRLIENRLFGLDARDMSTLALAAAVLLLTALLSSWLPARRAASTDPMESLRAE